MPTGPGRRAGRFPRCQSGFSIRQPFRVAVLVGRREYDRHTSKQGNFSDAYAAFAREVDLGRLAIDPDEAFAGIRPRERGREGSL